jgi:hypothetical protein
MCFGAFAARLTRAGAWCRALRSVSEPGSPISIANLRLTSQRYAPVCKSASLEHAFSDVFKASSPVGPAALPDRDPPCSRRLRVSDASRLCVRVSGRLLLTRRNLQRSIGIPPGRANSKAVKGAHCNTACPRAQAAPARPPDSVSARRAPGTSQTSAFRRSATCARRNRPAAAASPSRPSRRRDCPAGPWSTTCIDRRRTWRPIPR